MKASMKDEPTIVALIWVFLCLGFFVLSQHLRLVDSEIWSLYLAKNWNPLDGHFAGFFWKPLQVLLLRLTAIFAPGSDSTPQFISFGRYLWSFIFIAQIVFLVRLASRLDLSTPRIIFGGGLLMVSRYYLVESLHVRADTMATLFLTFLVWELIRRRRKREAPQEGTILPLALCAFFVGASSIKFLPQLGLILALGAAFFPELRRKIFWISFLGVTVLISLMMVSYAFENSRETLGILIRSWFEAGTSWDKYLVNLVFVRDQIIFFFPFWIFSGALFLFSVRKKDDDSRSNAFLSLFATLNSLVVLIHPEPYPWYAATTIPFHVICLLRATLLPEIAIRLETRGRWMTGVGAALMIIGFTNAFLNFRGMKTQLRAITDLEAFAGEFSIDSYYDNCGLLSSSKHSLPFISASQNSDILAAEMMFLEDPPEMVIETGRTVLLLPKLAAAYERNYVKDKHNMGIGLKRSLLERPDLQKKFSPLTPTEVFLNYPWREQWAFRSLFSPYLGYALW